MSAAADGSVTVWDVEEGDNVYRQCFDSPLHIVQLCPNSTALALVCPSHEGPFLFSLNRSRKKVPLPQLPPGVEVRRCRLTLSNPR